LHGKTIATHISSSFAKLQLADTPRAILHPRRWLIYTPEVPCIDGERACVVAVW
jgi:hypothetical protein